MDRKASLFKNIAKFMMVVFMIIGLIFSFLNITSNKTSASIIKKGAWVETPGSWQCMGDGNECTIGGGGIVN